MSIYNSIPRMQTCHQKPAWNFHFCPFFCHIFPVPCFLLCVLFKFFPCFFLVQDPSTFSSRLFGSCSFCSCFASFVPLFENSIILLFVEIELKKQRSVEYVSTYCFLVIELISICQSISTHTTTCERLKKRNC